MKSKILFTTVLAVALSACGGGGASGGVGLPLTPSNPTSPTTPLTMAEAFKQLEAEGKYPKLDRTTAIAGTDANGNGVRDDIDAYIQSLPDTPLQKKALIQAAKSLQSSLLSPLTETAVAEQISAIIKAISCIGARYPTIEELSTKQKTIEALTFNTQQRYKAWDSFNAAADGSSWESPETSETQCDE